MAPYFALLRDSFHAALASRVLWVALIAIWLLLAALAPVGYREDYTTDFTTAAFTNPQRLKSMLADAIGDAEAASRAVGRIAAALPADLRGQLQRVAAGEDVRIRVGQLAAGLNSLLDDDGWYDSKAWEGSHRLSEQRSLDAMNDSELSDSLQRRRARLRIESVFPGVFRARNPRSTIVTYAGMDFPTPLPGDKQQFATDVNQFVIPFVIEWSLGFALTLLGILVTASIIPDMLQPGSLHLLLSKPISRSLLLLSKYVGGCAFVFLCVVQLIVGLYLIAGVRLDIWNPRLLLCIPVAVFSFAVFYSVSLVAGLWWRSSILAIGVTLICGTLFFVLGFLFSLSDTFVRDPNKLHGVVFVGNTPVAANDGGGLLRYDRSSNRWREIIPGGAMGFDLTLRPVALSDTAAATAVLTEGRISLFGSGAVDLLVIGEATAWQPEPSLRLPAGTAELTSLADGRLLAVTTSNLVTIEVEQILQAAGTAEPHNSRREQDSGPTADQSDAISNDGSLLGALVNAIGGAATEFTEILPSGVSLTSPRDVTVAPNGSGLFVYSSGELTRLEPPLADADNTLWTVVAAHDLPGDVSLRAELAVSGSVLLVVRRKHPLQFFDADTLRPLAQLEFESSLMPTSIASLGNGRFVLATSDGDGELVEPTTADRSQFAVTGQLPIDHIHWVGVDRRSGKLLVVHHIDQLDVLDMNKLAVTQSIRPQLGRWRQVDRYVLTPLRMIVPQTGELGETIAAIISGRSGVAIPGGPEEGRVIRYHIYRPIFSCAAFITVMLTIGCVYFSTRDF